MSNAIKRTTSVNAASRGLDIVSRLIASVLCLYLAVTAPFAYAIDPITGAWTANAAASAAFGGGVTGGGAAIQAAVTAVTSAAATAATAAAAAALVAGAGVAAFCGASYLYGTNSCGGGSAISGGLQAAGISVDPKGDLVFNPRSYFSIPGTTLRFNSAQTACNAAVTQANNANKPKYHTLRVAQIYYLSSGAIGGADCLTTFTNPELTQNQSYDTQGRWVNYVTITTPQKAADEQVADAVAKNANARAAAAAAMGTPTLARAEAAAAAATAAPRTPEAECAAKGMKHGTFNGTVFCVGVSSTPNPNTDLTGEVGAGTGAGTGTDTANPPTTGNPPAAATPLPAFCVYAQTLCEWILWTKTEPAATGESANKVTIAESTESDVLPNFDIGQQRVVFTANCPASIPIHISMFGSSVNTSFSHQPLCEFMSNLRPFVIAAAYITGAYIIAGTGRGGGNDG